MKDESNPPTVYWSQSDQDIFLRIGINDPEVNNLLLKFNWPIAVEISKYKHNLCCWNLNPWLTNTNATTLCTSPNAFDINFVN